MAENDPRLQPTTNRLSGGIWQTGAFARTVIEKFGRNPATSWILVALAALGVILLLTGNDKGTAAVGKLPADHGLNKHELNEPLAVSADTQLADELAWTLEKIDGVGRVRVKVNYRSRNRKIWERQIHESKRTSQEQQTVNTEENTNNELVFAKSREGHDQPVLREELAPVIEGVIVVAEGARDVRLKGMIIDAVSTILGIPVHRIMVVPGN